MKATAMTEIGAKTHQPESDDDVAERITTAISEIIPRTSSVLNMVFIYFSLVTTRAHDFGVSSHLCHNAFVSAPKPYKAGNKNGPRAPARASVPLLHSCPGGVERMNATRDPADKPTTWPPLWSNLAASRRHVLNQCSATGFLGNTARRRYS